ncbi:MAG: ThiF family adenylyltransferase, partial [Chitinophagaceae bacterium]
DESNLQRQVLYTTDDIGKWKTEVTLKRLKALNPLVKYNVYNDLLTTNNASDIITGYDIIADCSDNFPTRYLVNDACVLLNKPLVYGAIFQFEGQVSLFNYRNRKGELGPNYRDLYPSPPPPNQVPSCAEGGVLGVLAGIIGSMQALEIIKVATGIGETLSGRFFIFDALHFESRTITIKRQPDNPLNGDHPTIKELINYELICGANNDQIIIKSITPKELKEAQKRGDNVQVIDVREPDEYQALNIKGTLIPLATITEHINKIDREKMVVVHCKGGSRSTKAIKELQEKYGFTNLYNLQGGITAYFNEG